MKIDTITPTPRGHGGNNFFEVENQRHSITIGVKIAEAFSPRVLNPETNFREYKNHVYHDHNDENSPPLQLI
jgi:hypothetical protein